MITIARSFKCQSVPRPKLHVLQFSPHSTSLVFVSVLFNRDSLFGHPLIVQTSILLVPSRVTTGLARTFSRWTLV